jgi:hypothetical protein
VLPQAHQVVFALKTALGAEGPLWVTGVEGIFARQYRASFSHFTGHHHRTHLLQPQIRRDHRGVGMKLGRRSRKRHNAGFEDIASAGHVKC